MYYKRIRDLREDKDLTQKQLAEYLNVSQKSYSRYERGERTIDPEILSNVLMIKLITLRKNGAS